MNTNRDTYDNCKNNGTDNQFQRYRAYQELFDTLAHQRTIEYNILQAKHAIDEADAILILCGSWYWSRQWFT